MLLKSCYILRRITRKSLFLLLFSFVNVQNKLSSDIKIITYIGCIKYSIIEIIVHNLLLWRGS